MQVPDCYDVTFTTPESMAGITEFRAEILDFIANGPPRREVQGNNDSSDDGDDDFWRVS